MRKQIILIIYAFCLMPSGLMAQKDSTAAKEPVRQPISDTTASKKTVPIAPLAAVIDSNDDNNFLELYYYGPDMDGSSDIYDPWDIYPDREGDAAEREAEDRDSQERDTRE